MYDTLEFATLVGKTFASVTVSDDKGEIVFVAADGERFEQMHDQDCCEMVEVAEVVGDLADLIGSPILQAEEVIHEGETPEGLTEPDTESYTWTFYKLATIKGSVTIRWLGESDGYYSETVSLYRRAA